MLFSRIFIEIPRTQWDKIHNLAIKKFIYKACTKKEYISHNVTISQSTETDIEQI